MHECLAETLPLSTAPYAEQAVCAAGQESRHGPLLSVVIPAYNEAKTIGCMIERVLEVSLDIEVVVVDDGSTDDTRMILEGFVKDNLVVLFHERNRGKGAAIRTGLARARGQFVIVQDADLEYDPADYDELLKPLIDGRACVVYGSRYLRREKQTWRLFREGVRLLNWAVWLLYGARLTDEATCYKIMPTELLRSLDLQCERFEFCPEVTAKVCRLKIPIVELPIHYNPRTNQEGKKIRIRDGWEALETLWRYRKWRPRSDRMGNLTELVTSPSVVE